MESRSKSPLALMEQVIMVLIFALAAAICVQAFVTARSLSIQSKTKDKAMEICQNVAEEYKAGQPDSAPEDVCYNEEWQVDTKAVAYRVQYFVENENEYHICGRLVVMDEQKKKAVCQLRLAWQKGGSHE